MRIISGQYRGFKLKSLEGEDVRPTLDRVREAVFNMIQFDVQGAKVLDMFAGSGAMGIEAASRGCAEVTFNDSYKAALNIVRENCSRVKLAGANFYNYDYRELCRALEREGKSFDIIFVDPPYGGDTASAAAQQIAAHNLLTSGGKIIVEHLAKNPLNLKDNLELTALSSKKYGIVAIDILQKQ